MLEKTQTPESQGCISDTTRRWLCASGVIIGLGTVGVSIWGLPHAQQLEARLTAECNVQTPQDQEQRERCLKFSDPDSYRNMAIGGLVAGTSMTILTAGMFPSRRLA